ncbi:hypothetical protein J4219_04510 [Candidatus Woesearchaeota archaeon]|nr:hypothetical protein [Candidatus Woesearchaeota archaeon]
MVNMTLAIPEEMNKIMKKHTEIRWSEIARKAMWQYAVQIERMERILSKSKLTEKDAEEIGEKIKKGLHKRYYQ